MKKKVCGYWYILGFLLLCHLRVFFSNTPICMPHHPNFSPIGTKHTHIHTTKYQYRTPTLDCQEFSTVYNCKENDDMLPAKTSTSGGCWLDGKLVGVPTYQPTEEPTTPLYVIAILKVCVSRLCILTRLLCLSFVFYQPYNSGACKFIQKKMPFVSMPDCCVLLISHSLIPPP